MSKLAKDVAKELDRRRRRRRLVFVAAFAAAIVAALLYLRCGQGWGTGGKGPGAGGSAIGSAARRCALRVTATGIMVDGKPATQEAAVTACKSTTGADVIITGDAREGDWDSLRAALDAAHVAVYVRDTRGGEPPADSAELHGP